MTRSDLKNGLQNGSWKPLAEARNWSKARAYSGEFPPGSGREAVAKDIQSLPLWFRWLFARPVLRREWQALRALEHVAGVPKLLARIDADCFVMEKCAGRALHDLPQGAGGEELLRKLDALVAQVHARGVTHGDLHRDNILRGADGQIGLIDWATAHVYGVRPRGWKKRALEEFRALDLRAVAKIKAYSAAHLLTDAERDLLVNGGSALYRGVKKMRRTLHALQGRKSAPGIDYRKLVE